MYSVEMTSAGDNHGQRDVEAASQEEAVAIFLDTLEVSWGAHCVTLEPYKDESNYEGWSRMVISVGPVEDYEEE
jgi:hypothetical protein